MRRNNKMPLENGIILNKDGELFRKLELLRRENELGLDRNIICRLGFLKSLDEPGIPSWEEYMNSFSKESGSLSFQIKKDVLFGEFYTLYVALLKQRISEETIGEVTPEIIDQMGKAHIARGILRCIPSRLKQLCELSKLLD